MRPRLTLLTATMVALTACNDAPTTQGDYPLATATSLNEPSSPVSCVRWNRKARALFRARGGALARANAYLSLAQYRAVLAAQDAQHGTLRPSAAGAVAGASAAVLRQF